MRKRIKQGREKVRGGGGEKKEENEKLGKGNRKIGRKGGGRGRED